MSLKEDRRARDERRIVDLERDAARTGDEVLVRECRRALSWLRGNQGTASVSSNGDSDGAELVLHLATVQRIMNVTMLVLRVLSVGAYIVFFAFAVETFRWQLGYEKWWSSETILLGGTASFSTIISAEFIFWHVRRRKSCADGAARH